VLQETTQNIFAALASLRVGKITYKLYCFRILKQQQAIN
jgi:hypothetical protein